MDKEEIDELIIDINTNNEFRYILEKYLKIEIPEDVDVGDFKNERVLKLWKKLMNKIENGDYNYFWQLINSNEHGKLLDLMAFSSKVEDIKYLIEHGEELKLDHSNIVNLIKATEDKKYIKKCIEDREKREKLKLDFYIVDLLKAMENKEYIKECIESREKREELKLACSDIIDLIEAMEDKEYIRECIENQEKREKLGLIIRNIVYLIEATEDKKYIRECIKNRDKLGLDTPNIAHLIKKYIRNREKLDLNGNMTSELILLSGNIDYIIWCEKNLELQKLDKEKIKIFTKKSNIKLPSDMTIGVEIESEGEKKDNSYLIELLTEDAEWETKRDGSLRNGTEIVSPVLAGNKEKASNEIKNVCAVLNGIPQTVSERCGGHIHIGADYLKTKKDMVNLIKIWSNAEKILYIISNEKGEIPRKKVLKYAPPISKKLEKAIKDGTINIESEEDLEKFTHEVVKTQEDRYSDVNFCNIGSKEKNTIEFRLPNGTINPNTWIENVNLFGGIVKVAHELSVIQEKTEEQMTEYEKKLL